MARLLLTTDMGLALVEGGTVLNKISIISL